MDRRARARRLSAHELGSTTPVSPTAALRDWDRGTTSTPAWENWDTGVSGVGRLGFGLDAAYSTLPLNDPLFRDTSRPVNGATVTSASSARAGILEVTSRLACGFRSPYIMPNLSLGLRIHRLAARSRSTTSRRWDRQGPTATPTRAPKSRVGGGVDKTSLRSLRRLRRGPVHLRLHELRQRVRAGRRLQLAGCDTFRNGTRRSGRFAAVCAFASVSDVRARLVT